MHTIPEIQDKYGLDLQDAFRAVLRHKLCANGLPAPTSWPDVDIGGWVDCDMDKLDQLYQQCLQPARRGGLGAWYTPPDWAKRVTSTILNRYDTHAGWSFFEAPQYLLEHRIADIACGSGVFLETAYEYLKDGAVGYRKKNVSCRQWDNLKPIRDATPRDIRRWVATECVYGADIEPIAVDMARCRMCLLLDDPDVGVEAFKGNIVCGDAFDDATTADWPSIDSVVGNPPFLGGFKISGTFGKAYAVKLVRMHPEGGGTADLCAHFLRRAATLTMRDRKPQFRNTGTSIGLICTNTISQGKTRKTGLQYLVNNGWTIFQAETNLPWPHAAVSVSIVYLFKYL